MSLKTFEKMIRAIFAKLNFLAKELITALTKLPNQWNRGETVQFMLIHYTTLEHGISGQIIDQL